jgi:hypothetical protein
VAWSTVETVGVEFMPQCTSLQSIDLSHLTVLQRIGRLGLARCYSLAAFDLRGLANLTGIPEHGALRAFKISLSSSFEIPRRGRQI